MTATTKNTRRATQRQSLPIAMTVAGSDSGGGAGLQADLKVFAALGVHGVSAITCITAQNPREVRAVSPTSTAMVRAQMEALFAELPPAALKTGMLFSEPIIKTVAAVIGEQQKKSKSGNSTRLQLVIDPVMVATSGAQLLKPSAVRSLIQLLLPLATVVTPNLDEAEILLGKKIRDVQAAREAAVEIYERFGCNALVKGGHLGPAVEAADFFYDGRDELLVTAPYVKGVSTHGTGCTYSAAITAHLAKGTPLVQAIVEAKTFITNAILSGYCANKHFVLRPIQAQ